MLHQCYRGCNTLNPLQYWAKSTMLQMLHLLYKNENMTIDFFQNIFFGVTSVTFTYKTNDTKG